MRSEIPAFEKTGYRNWPLRTSFLLPDKETPRVSIANKFGIASSPSAARTKVDVFLRGHSVKDSYGQKIFREVRTFGANSFETAGLPLITREQYAAFCKMHDLPLPLWEQPDLAVQPEKEHRIVVPQFGKSYLIEVFNGKSKETNQVHAYTAVTNDHMLDGFEDMHPTDLPRSTSQDVYLDVFVHEDPFLETSAIRDIETDFRDILKLCDTIQPPPEEAVRIKHVMRTTRRGEQDTSSKQARVHISRNRRREFPKPAYRGKSPPI